MKELENVIINKTARIEEIIAYLISKKYIFKDKKCFIGDNGIDNCPDIYSIDKKVGAEVVTCENYDTFKIIEKSFQGNYIDKQTFIKFKKQRIKEEDKSYYDYKKYTTEEDEFYDNLKTSLLDKLQNQQFNHYRGCNNVNLIIMSCFKNKNFIEPLKLAKGIINYADKFSNKYEHIFFVTQDYIICINKDLKYKIINDNTFNNLINDNGLNY